MKALLMVILLLMMALGYHPILAMYMPQDIEILDGYDLEEPPNTYLPGLYYEEQSLNEPILTKAIRNKRSPIYHVLESHGLRSHFHLDSSVPLILTKASDIDDSLLIPPQMVKESYVGRKRDLDGTLERRKRSEQSLEEHEEVEELPKPEKQIMESDFYRNGDWNVRSFNTEYSKVQQEEEDSLAEASMNEGIKGRTPRVNFITQAKKNAVQNGNNDGQHNQKEHQRHEIPTLQKAIIATKSNYEKAEPRLVDDYPSRSYDPYLRRYDRFDDQYNRYDPHYENYYLHRRRYDPYDSYSPRMPSYPEPYYDYPDRRYDLPEPRDYRPMWMSDIYSRVPPYPTYHTYPARNRRIIYYAHLPEVIRTPPSVDLTYRYNRDRLNQPGYGSPAPSNGGYLASSPVNRDNPGFIKREKKDHRNYLLQHKSGMNAVNTNINNNNNKKEHRA